MLTRATVNVIFEGNLSPDRSLAQVLEDVLTAPVSDTAVLRVASPARQISGRLAIARGRYVVGAQVDDDAESGYPAVRSLLAIDEGNFALLDSEGRFPFDVDPSLHIAIDRILELLPALPENPGELFDEKALLDEIFSADSPLPRVGRDSLEVLPQMDQALDSAAMPESQAQPESAWAALQPFLMSDPGCPQQGPLLAGVGRQRGAHAIAGDERRITFGKLKAAAMNRLSWQHPGALAAIVLVVVLLALAVWSLFAHWGEVSFTGSAPVREQPR